MLRRLARVLGACAQRSVRLCRPDAEGATANRWRSTSAIMTSTASRTGELLQAEVAVVGDEHVPAGIDGDARSCDQRTGTRAANTPLGHERPRIRELLDPGVVQVADEDVPARIQPDVVRVPELPIQAAQAAPLGEEGPRIGELL